MNNVSLDDLRERALGKRVYNAARDETFTVLSVEEQTALLQYDDGIQWEEAYAPDLLTAGEYEVIGTGPILDDACDDGHHSFYPHPSHLGVDDVERWNAETEGVPTSTVFQNVVRCQRCGLSGSVLSKFLGHATPTICARCESDVMPSPSQEGSTLSDRLCEACAEREDLEETFV